MQIKYCKLGNIGEQKGEHWLQVGYDPVLLSKNNKAKRLYFPAPKR